MTTPPPIDATIDMTIETYTAGSVVNGHVFDGRQWHPLSHTTPAAAQPSTYTPGSIVNGHMFDGRQWIPLQTRPAHPTRMGISTAEHVIHGVITVCTVGLWAPVWIIRAISASRRFS